MSSQKNIWMLDKWYAQSVAGNTGYVGERKLYSWGSNGQGFLGLNDVVNRSSPTQIPGTTWTTKIDQGHTHMMCIKTDGTLWAVGENEFGQSAQNDIVRRSSPVQIPGTDWSRIRSGAYMTMAIKEA